MPNFRIKFLISITGIAFLCSFGVAVFYLRGPLLISERSVCAEPSEFLCETWGYKGDATDGDRSYSLLCFDITILSERWLFDVVQKHSH